MKYEVKFTNQFKKDLKLAKKQNKDLDKLFEIVNILASGGTLDAKYRDHDLSGNYKGTRECHIPGHVHAAMWVMSLNSIAMMSVMISGIAV